MGADGKLDGTPPAEFVGIDLSPAMLAVARQRAAATTVTVDLPEMDAQRMAFPDHGFDTVLFTQPGPGTSPGR
jgi:ubiquinone/menaquinone biosynthesis C-methylase UbiE